MPRLEKWSAKKMSIFNILHSNKTGGAELMYLYYSEILKKAGHEVYCVVPSKFQYSSELEKLNITPLTLNIKGHYDVLAALKLYLLVRKYQPEIIMAHNGRSFAAINLIRKFIKAKTIAVSHGGSLKRLLKFDLVIPVAKYIKRNLIDRNYSGEIKHIANFRKITPYKKSKKKDFNFGIIGRLNPEKNIALAIRSFSEFVKSETNNAKLIIAGSGPEKDNLVKLVNDLSINQNVVFLDWVKDLEEFFGQVNVMLLPSFEEPFGLVILEAFNYYTPVISSNKGGPLEIIQDEETGFFFESNNEQDLLDKMLFTYQNQKILDKISQNAYASLKEHYSFQAGEQKLLNIIKSL